MANWNDPQPTRTGFGASPGLNGGSMGQATTVDQGLRRYMLSIYNYMASGVMLSGVVAMLFANSAIGQQILLGGGPLRWLIALAPLAFVMVMSFGANRLSTAALQATFWGFCAVMGLSLSTIVLMFTGGSIAATFFATSGAFAGLSLVGYTTKRDLSGMGSFMIMGLVGILIASLVNVFLHSSGLQWGISFLGVLIFAGLIAYDTQRLKSMYYQINGSEFVGKAVVLGALSLYLDFINLFQFLLQFMGDRR
ncbi:Bax inhibitor-1/YccA family protein [Novosphingobium lentum]|uniref:Bax inhibitor-1/YccA family protein n=1 Tax=Novosphingobium lentum TaxID=145287 RepID=UPI000832AC62|nr:Bax inhibitor-1/YccA family protein [Novosphingobium lentum]